MLFGTIAATTVGRAWSLPEPAGWASRQGPVAVGGDLPDDSLAAGSRRPGSLNLLSDRDDWTA